MRETIEAVEEAFNGAGDPRLAIASIDFAVGRIGGGYGDRVLLAVVDLNLCCNGGEFLHSYRDRVTGSAHAATLAYRPTPRPPWQLPRR